jgi:hypothetical protein
MVLDSLSPDVRAALVACCTIQAFDDERFDALVAATAWTISGPPYEARLSNSF